MTLLVVQCSLCFQVNYVWDRIEKCIFLVIDLGLNVYFIRMVKNRLIANGLTKYNRLLRVNILMVVINIALDVRRLVISHAGH